MPRVDGRTVESRRYKQLIQAYAGELGNELTEADRGLIASAAAVALRIERLQADIVQGRDVAADQIIRLSSEHRRQLAALRARAAKNKPKAPNILDFAAELAAEAATPEASA
jgi:hypothetical protein